MPSATPHRQSSYLQHHTSDGRAQFTARGTRVWNSFARAWQPANLLQTSALSTGDAGVPDRPSTKPQPVPDHAARAGRALPPARRGRQHNPRVLAALAYAVPLVPALILLARERRNRFVRLHAAQALVFFCLIALAQAAVFAGLIITGGIVTNTSLAITLGLVSYGLFALIGLYGFIIWLLMLADAMAGQRRRRRVFSGLADALERVLTRGRPSTSISAGPERNPPTQ